MSRELYTRSQRHGDTSSYCAICGKKRSLGPHRCAESTLRRIDAAHDNFDPEEPLAATLRTKTLEQRLRDGFATIGASEQ